MKNNTLSHVVKLKGSSLVSVMIFSFVVLVTISSLAYIFRYNLVSVKSLIRQETIDTVEQQYIQQIVDKGSIKIGKNSLGNYIFENTLKTRQALFSNKDVDSELYHGQPSAISSNIIHKLTYKDKLEVTKDIIYKALPERSMINYNSSIVPINVPYIDISRMDNSEKFYHLDKNSQVKDSEVGFVGFIKKEYDWFLISVNNQAEVIDLKSLDLARNYKIKIGWNLENGRWQMMMALYDKDHLYIFRTSLNNLVNNLNKAALDLETPIGISNSLSNIAAISWYYQRDNSEPSLVVLETRPGNNDNLSVVVENLSYDYLQNTYSTSIEDGINGFKETDSDNIYVIALDPSYMLSQSPLYIFVGRKMIVYDVDNSYKVKRRIMVLNEKVFNKPIVVKKDVYDYYILTYDDDHYLQYKYTKNTDVITSVKPVVYPDEKIQNIIVRYGLKFIVTKDHLYIDDFQNRQLNKISI
ncbi:MULTISPECIES: hypothetical protein [unclassified Francisella]|uniref:hypothetical protein n=1 Tax=unclassified Francisella TaxID=2610885 RepID=UPI002E377368|nr:MULTISPECIES: hypothetical protein [unclassified Francisella]MED7819878.1 hypothetical protein [Francisella sp. 19S2-4]MED7830704.1 hypothetical protein [Francisella sp. 19S2-10]